jgi:dTDP-glucose 4,6-dehydratase
MDSSKIHNELGWQPRHTLQSGLVDTVRWYLENPDWIASIRKRADYQDWIDNNYEQKTK